MAYKTFGGGTYSLGASIGSTDTTILLTSFTEPVSGTPYTMALLGTDIIYATIAPGTSSSEFISFSGITQNLDGTATLTGVVRGLAKKSPFTTSATFKLPHSSQTTFIISNPPQLYEKFVSMVNDETIAGIKTFSSFPITPSSAPTTDYQVSNKKYVDDAVIAGAVKATNLVYGISKLSVAAASASDPIVVGDNDNRVSPVSLATVTADRVAALAGTGTPNGTTGKYVTNDDTSATISANKVARFNAGGTGITGIPVVTDVQVFNTPGANTWTKPAGAKAVHVVCIGGGGGGGGVGTGASNFGGGGGGGAGLEAIFDASVLGATETATVGASGAGGAAGSNPGVAGGNSSFGSWLIAYGGGGGAGAVSGTNGGGGGGGSNAAGTSVTSTTGGAGGGILGGAAGADSTFGGGGGGSGAAGGGSIHGGGGGGGGNSGSQYNGGSSKYGGGGGGSGGVSASTGGTAIVYGGNGGAGAVAGAGGNGTAPGGGGGGAGEGAESTAHKGGDGAVGRIIVITYF